MTSVGIRVGARGSTAVSLPATPDEGVAFRSFRRSRAGTDPVRSLVDPVRASLLAVLDQLGPDETACDVVVDLGPVLLDRLLSATRPAGVSRVCAVRLGHGGPTIRAPFEGWPADVRSRLEAGTVIADGGVDVFGTALTPLDAGRVAADVAARLEPGVAVAVTAVGAVVSAEGELAVADLLDAVAPAGMSVPVVLSHTVGGLRLLERENTALLQAALLAGARELVDALSSALSGLAGRLAFTLADGSRTTREQFAAAAVRSLGGREAAQLVGAVTLAGVADAVVLVLPGAAGPSASEVPRATDDQAVRIGWVEAGRPRVEQLGTVDRLLPTLPLTLAQAVSVATTLAEVLSAPEVWLDSTADRVVVADGGAGAVAVDRAAQLLRRTGHGLVTVVHPLAATVDAGPDGDTGSDGDAGPDGEAGSYGDTGSDGAARAGDVLSAVGVTAFQAVADLERIVATDDAAELDAVLGSLTELASSRVLGADGDPGRLDVLERRAAPLSFLRSGVHLVRVRVAAPVTQQPAAARAPGRLAG